MAQTLRKLIVKYDADIKGISKKLDDMNKHIVGSNEKVKEASSSMSGMWKQMAGGMAAFAVVKKGFSMLNGFIESSIENYKIQEKAEVLLQSALRMTGDASNKTFEDLKLLASGIQGVTTVGDEVSLKLMQLGITMGISKEKIGDATKGAIGLSKAFGIDLNASMKMVALALNGDYNMLQRYIPALKTAKSESEKYTIVMRAMSDGYKIAQAETDTLYGKSEQLSMKWGDMKEGIGGAFAEVILPALESFSDWVDNNQDTIITAFEKIAGVIGNIVTSFQLLIEAIGKSSKPIVKVTDDLEALYKRGSITGYGVEVKNVTNWFNMWQRQLRETANGLKVVEKETKDGVTTIKDFGKGTGEATDKVVELSKAMGIFDDRGTAAEVTYDDVIRTLFGVETALSMLGISLGDSGKEIKEITEDTTELDLALEKQKESWNTLSDALGMISEKFKEMGGTAGDVLGEIASGLSGAISAASSGDVVSGVMAFGGMIQGLMESVLSGAQELSTPLEDWQEIVEVSKEGSKAMWEFIQDMTAQEVEIEEMADFISDKVNKGISALSDYYKWAADSQDKFNRAQVYTIALFSGLLAQGHSFVEAVKMMKEQFTELNSIIEQSGYQVTESLGFMLDMTRFIENNEVLANSISAVNDIMDSVFQSGIYNMEQMSGVLAAASSDVVDQFNEVLRLTGNQDMAYAMTIDNLRQIVYYANEYGIAIDEATAELIRNAEEAGYSFDGGIIPPMERVATLMEDLVVMFADWLGIMYDLPWAVDQVNQSYKNLGDTVHGIDLGGGGRVIEPMVHAQGGFRGLLEKDITIRAHKDEYVNITPAHQVQGMGMTRVGDTRNIFNMNIAGGGGESDFQKAGQLKRIFKYNINDVTTTIKQETDRLEED